MTILASDLKFCKASSVSNLGSNGGLMSPNLYVTSVLQNLFNNVLSSERTTGSTVYRKIFCKNANDSDETFYGSKLCLFAPTAGDDWVVFFAGTQEDVQSDITGAERLFGAGTIAQDVTAGDYVIVLDVEDTSITGIFQAGDEVYITNKATYSGSGDEETRTIDSIDSVSGVRVTLTLTEPVSADYNIGSFISSIYDAGDVECTVSDWSETGAFTYDENNFPVVCDNIGTVEETWTLTFLNATTFSVSGATVGSVGSGNISTSFAPSNPDFTKPFFTLNYLGWGGTPVAGNSLVFKTHPSSIPVWEKKVTPAGANSMTINSVLLLWMGEAL